MKLRNLVLSLLAISMMSACTRDEGPSEEPIPPAPEFEETTDGDMDMMDEGGDMDDGLMEEDVEDEEETDAQGM